MNRDGLEKYALYYDKKVLGALKDAPILLLHICSSKHENPQQNGGLMEKGWFKNYPVNAINWWDACFTPCSEAKRIYGDKFCIASGVNHGRTMRYHTPKEVEEEVKRSIEGAAEGGGFIIAPGCTLFQNTPVENFNAVARGVQRYGRYRK